MTCAEAVLMSIFRRVDMPLSDSSGSVSSSDVVWMRRWLAKPLTTRSSCLGVLLI